MPILDAGRIETLALKADGRIDAPVRGPACVDEDALELARLALMLPAALVMPVPRASPLIPRSCGSRAPPFAATAKPRLRTSKSSAARLCRSKARRGPSSWCSAAGRACAIRWRSWSAARSVQPVAVRLHSACLTGDLFGSLKCDCGDQLRGQCAGWRRTGAASCSTSIRKGAGTASPTRSAPTGSRRKAMTPTKPTRPGLRAGRAPVRLRGRDAAPARRRPRAPLTNNPEKAPRCAGPGSTWRRSIAFSGARPPENVRYLAAKRDRAGHMIGFEAAAARAQARIESRPRPGPEMLPLAACFPERRGDGIWELRALPALQFQSLRYGLPSAGGLARACGEAASGS